LRKSALPDASLLFLVSNMCLLSNQTGRASEHARTAAPLTGATRHNGDTFFSRGSSSLSERERLSTKREPGRKSLKNHRATRKQRCASSVGPLDLPKPHLLLYKARGGLGYHRIERPSSFGRLSLVRSHDKRARRWTRHAVFVHRPRRNVRARERTTLWRDRRRPVVSPRRGVSTRHPRVSVRVRLRRDRRECAPRVSTDSLLRHPREGKKKRA